MRKIGTQIEAFFPTQSPSTGDSKDADSLPTATVYKNNASDALSVTVSNVATGLYKAYFTPTSGAGFASGDRVVCVVAATVSGIDGYCEVVNDVLQTGLPADVYSDTTILVSDSAVLSVTAATIASDLVLIYSDTTAVHSDTTILVSDSLLLSGVPATITAIASDAAIIEASVGNLSVATAALALDMTSTVAVVDNIYSDTTVIASDLVIAASDIIATPAAVWAETLDGEAYSAVMQLIRSFGAGKVAISGSTLTFYRPNGTTTAFTMTLATTGRIIT